MKKNEITVFNYESNKVRTIERGGEPWFVLKDVCEVLELANPTVVAQRLDEEERAKLNLGRQGDALIINESGLYSVILRSDKEQAKQFKKWVTGEVLPSIRKTGAYGHTQEQIKIKEGALKAREENQRIKKALLMHEISKDITEPTYRNVLQRHITELLTGEKITAREIKKENRKVTNFRVEGTKEIKIIVSDMISKEPFYYWEIDTDTHFLYMRNDYWENIEIRNKYINFVVEKLKKIA